MLKKHFVLPCLLLLSAPFSIVKSAEWHIEPEIQKGGIGTAESPFATLDEAREAVRVARQNRTIEEPDTIWLHSGTYKMEATFELTSTDSGTADAPIIWKAKDPGQSTFLSVNTQVLIAVYDAEFIQIEGLKLIGATEQAVEVAHCHHVSIANCQVKSIGHTGVHLFGGSNCEVLGCEIQDCDIIGIRVEAGDRTTGNQAKHLVKDCRIENCGEAATVFAAAIHVAGIGSTIANNHVSNCENSGIRIDGNDHRIHENHLEKTCLRAANVGAIYMGHDPSETGNRIERNSIIQVGESPRLDAIAIFLDDATNDTVVYQNIISGAGRGIAIASGSGNSVAENMIEDCTVAIQLENRATTLLKASNRVQQNLLQRSGRVAVDSIDTLRANQVAGNIVGDNLFALNRVDESPHALLIASANEPSKKLAP
jgi:parallel beta-helix repeat protein